MKPLFLALFLFAASSLFAQQLKETSFTGCASDQLLHASPALLQAQQALDQEKYDNANTKGQPKGGVLKSLEVIPVVVHIVHTNGAENISDAQVVTAIGHFNARFAASPDNQIQFCLAQRDPDGNATTGITRNVSPLTTETMEIDDIQLKDLNRWSPTCYLNIWIVKEILSASMGSGVVGYAYLPSAHGQPMDGIVIEAAFFGSSYDNDAVGVHEIGHYLGLYHTFEGGCNNANCQLNGDQVCDTPPDQTTFASCNPPANSCSTDAQDPSPNNPFTTDVSDLSNDYMDYSNMSCYNLFTAGQYERMHYFLTTTRQSLLNCMSCLPPCPAPIAATIDNPAGTMNVVVGTTVNFSGTVTNATSYEWYITPGSPISTGLTASNTFGTTGSYWVKFRAPSNDPDFCLDGLDSVLIIVSEPTVASCNGSLIFDGTGNIAVDLPLTNHYYTGDNGGYTWECWFRLNAPFNSDVRPLISAIDQVTFEDQYLGFGWQGGWFNEPVNRLVFKVDGPNSTVPTGPNCSYEPAGGWQTGTWYHAAGVMDYTAQSAMLYVNGQLVDTKPVTTPPITRPIPAELSFNWSNTPLPLNGNMDEVRIWDRARTATEISDYYNQCVDAADPNLFVYYHCNQSAGSTVVDATPNGNDGTFSVSEGWSPDEPAFIGISCIVSCIEICGNGIDDNNDGAIDEDCDCPAISATADDTVTCPGVPVQLHATDGFTDYSWSPVTGLSDPNTQNPTAAPTVPTTYTVTGMILGPELVVNGDFSAGNFGFTSGQNYTIWYSPCNYYVGPNFFTIIDPTIVDHTPTADNFFMGIDGCTSQTYLWEQTLMGLQPNTDYNFSFWASRADQVQPDFEIHFIGDVTGDQIVGTQAGIPYVGVWTWDQYGVTSWNSGSNTSVTVRIENLEIDGWGDDFALDDFSFRTMCSSTASVFVNTEAHVVPTLDLGPDIGVCASGTHTLTAQDGFAAYLWQDGGTGTSFTAFGPGTYWVTCTDSCGSVQTDTVHISLLPQPVIDLGDDIAACLQNATVHLGYTGNAVFTSFQWTPAASLSCEHCPDPVASPSGPTMYYLTATTDQGCTAMDSVLVTLEEMVPIALTVTVTDATCITGGVVELEATSPTSDLILFNFNNQGYSPVDTYAQLAGGVYTLSIQAWEQTCHYDTVIEVLGEEYTVYIPNTFTPNDDLFNKTWSVHGHCIADLECHIFNRWGEEIATLRDPEEAWDGTYRGKPVPDGVYTYTVVVTFGIGEPYVTNGFVTVIR